MQFRWPRPRLTSSQPELEGIEESFTALPSCETCKLISWRLSVADSLRGGYRVRRGWGQGVSGVMRVGVCVESPRSVTVQTRCETHNTSCDGCKEFKMCFARLSFVCLRTKLLFTVGAVSDRRHSYVYTAHEHAGLQVCRNCPQVLCSQVCVCLKPRSTLNISSCP